MWGSTRVVTSAVAAILIGGLGAGLGCGGEATDTVARRGSLQDVLTATPYAGVKACVYQDETIACATAGLVSNSGG